MLRLHVHPDSTWPMPYETRRLDGQSFKRVGRVRLEEKDPGHGCYTFASGAAKFRMRVCDPGIIRFSLAPDGVMPPDDTFADRGGPIGVVRYDWPVPRHAFRKTGNGWTLSTAKLTAVVSSGRLGLTVRDKAGRLLLKSAAGGFGVRRHGNAWQTLSYFDRTQADRFYGFGGRTHKPDRTGSSADMFSIKVERNRGDYGGFPIPYFLNTRGYGFFLDNPWPRVYFDLGRSFDDQWFVHTPGGHLDFYVLAGPEFSGIARLYCELTGYPVLADKWQYGFWVSWTDPHLVAKDTVDIAGRLRDGKWPVDVMVADYHWRGGQYNTGKGGGTAANMDWHPEFGDGPGMLRKLHAMNIRYCLHLNTAIFSGDMLRRGTEAKALRTVQNGVVVPRVLDRAAADWYWKTHEPRVAEGADLWWTDNGERVDGELENGLPSRNLFGHLWNKLLFDGMRRAGCGNRLVLSRGGWAGAQRFTLTWPGDTGPGVDRLREDLWWHLNCSVSGIPWNTVDFGGFFDGPCDVHLPENIVRRVANAMLLFTVPRIHGSARLPWQYDEQVQKTYREFLEMRYRLFPYIYSAIVECSQAGTPPYRPLVWDWPGDPEAASVDDQLMCGGSLMFAPVIREGEYHREVYLPRGKWFDFWTGEPCRGGRRILVEAPLHGLGGLPAFVKAGAVIPMRPLCMRNADGHERELTLHLFPARSGRQVFYDAPGLSYEITHRVVRGKLEVSVTNPLDVPRKINLAVHGHGVGGCGKQAGKPDSSDPAHAVGIEVRARSAGRVALKVSGK